MRQVLERLVAPVLLLVRLVVVRDIRLRFGIRARLPLRRAPDGPEGLALVPLDFSRIRAAAPLEV